MAIVQSYTMTAREGGADDLAQALEALAGAVQASAGAQGAMVLRDRQDSPRFLFLEFWDNEESRKAAGALLPKELMARIMAAQGGPLTMVSYERLAG